jgi:hypothetical protein
MNGIRSTILTKHNGEVKFSNEIEEYILDENMELKAVKLRNGETIDHEHIHRQFTPKHPLLKTPLKIKKTLDQFFLHEFKERRLAAGI